MDAQAAALLPGVKGPSVDVSFTLHRGQSSSGGLLLRAWLHADAPDAQPTAAAVIVDWKTESLEVSILKICF
jgi:hypothetical protein